MSYRAFLIILIISIGRSASAQVDFLLIKDGFGQPGEALTQPIEIVLSNQNELRGLQFELEYDPIAFTISSVSGANRLSEFSVSSNVRPGRLAVLVTDLDGAAIAAGSGSVITVESNISAIQPRTVPVRLTNIVFSNSSGQALLGAGADGYIFMPGTNAVRMNNGRLWAQGDTIDLDLYNETALGGVQLTLHYPGRLMQISSVQKTGRSQQMDLHINAQRAGELIAVLTSTAADSILAGAGPLLRFAADSVGNASATGATMHPLALNDVVLSNVQGEGVEHEAFDGVLFTGIPVPPVSVSDGSQPERISLSQNYPNPFNPETRIDFALPHAGEVQISIYNLLGQKVRTLLDGLQTAGEQSVVWDGKTRQGAPAESGVYLIRMQAGRFVAVRKAVLVR